MVFPDHPTSTSLGGHYFRVGANGTTADYPDFASGGLGAATATAADGHTFGAKMVIFEGFVTEVAGAALLLKNDAGTTQDTIPAAITGTYVPMGTEGAEMKSGIGAAISTGTTARYRVYYRIIHAANYGGAEV